MRTLRTRATTVALAGALAFGLAACGGDDGGSGDDGSATTADDGSGTTADDGDDGAAGSTLQLTGTDGLAFEPTELTAEAGEITIELTSGAVNHSVVIEETDDQLVVEAGSNATATGTIELEPGTYTFYCDVPGHRDAGMEGTLTVE